MKSTLPKSKLKTKEKLRPKRYFIKTYGCQMNVADSEYIAGMLEVLGFAEAGSLLKADVVVINTCSVRQASEDKVYGLATKVEALKEKNSKGKVFVVGCMVGSVRGVRKRYPESVLRKKIPWADYLLEPDNIGKIPELLIKGDIISSWAKNVLKEYRPKRKTKKHAYVCISTGCDTFCAYCVVPYARGGEKSRSFEEIVDDVENLIANGYEYITLLGQNVNSWGIEGREKKLRVRTSSKEKLPFANLLRRLHEIGGLKKISFISSNPFDFTMDLVETLALPKIDRYLHLPVQSGDNEILKKMNRRHTVEDYKMLIKNIRKTVPGIKIGTDLIVGFPGESARQFQNTVKLCQEVKFSVAFIALYSERPGTLAAKLYEDDVSREVKKKRHAVLTKIVKENEPGKFPPKADPPLEEKVKSQKSKVLL